MIRHKTNDEYREDVRRLDAALGEPEREVADALWGVYLWPDPAEDDWLPEGHIYYALRLLYVAHEMERARRDGRPESSVDAVVSEALQLSDRLARRLRSRVTQARAATSEAA